MTAPEDALTGGALDAWRIYNRPAVTVPLEVFSSPVDIADGRFGYRVPPATLAPDECPTCYGSGIYPADTDDCDDCGGSGVRP